MIEPTIFQGVCYIVGASLIVFGIPSVLMFALTEYICKRIEKRA